MLGKLFKHELFESGRRLIPLNLILIAITLVGAILLAILPHNNSFALLAAPCLLVYVLSIFALFIITGVYLTMRFYKTVYSSQAYLTHTLPVSTSSILNTKIFTALLWVILSIILTVLSVLILVRVAAGDTVFYETVHTFRYLFPEMFNVSFVQMLAYLFGNLLLSCLAFLLSICASLAVGQLFNSYRILASIGAYIVFYLMQQVTGILFLVGYGISTNNSVFANNGIVFKIEESADAGLSAAANFGTPLVFDVIQSLIFGIAFYVICHSITRKRLNLE